VGCGHVISGDSSLEVAPPWLKVGTFVEYEGGDPVTFLFLDDTYVYFQDTIFVFRWECTAINGQIATINITLYVPNKTIRISTIMNITTNTREILYSNGTVIGKTCLRLPPYLKAGDKVAVSWKLPNEKIISIIESGGISASTCQGFQELYLVRNFTGLALDASFDLDTGILLDGMMDGTTTVNCLGLVRMGLIRYLRATNIDLGPRYWRTEILTFLFLTSPITIPATIITVLIVRKVRKKRKTKRE
jgi:hypothetical protein